MTAHEPVTDTDLEAMLARLTARGWTEGLDTSIMAAVDATPQQRPWIQPPAWRLSLQPQLRLLFLLAIVGLLLALVAGTVIVGSRLLDRTPERPDAPAIVVPSGIETLSEAVTYQTTVVDDEGVLWSVGRGTLARYEPATGAGRSWNVDDDSRFAQASWAIMPARAGGVWLVGEQTLLRFDGTDFRDTVEVGAEIATATEAPDGTLWAATTDGDLVHIAGSSRTHVAVPGATGDAYISAIAVDEAGYVWCGLTQPGRLSRGQMTRLDGGHWQTFDEADATPLGSAVKVIAPLADGSIWVGTEWSSYPDDSGVTQTSPGGLAYYDGGTWTDAGAGQAALQGMTVTSVASGADGSIWAALALSDGSVAAAQRKGDGWTLYGTADGLPGVGEANYALAQMVPASGRVFIGTGGGIYELVDGRWERIWPQTPPTGPGDWSPARLVAVSHDEAWVATWEHVWHYADGAWSEASTPASAGTIRDVLAAPDGTLWVAADGGLFLRSGSAWKQVSPEPAGGVGTDDNGHVWASAGSTVAVKLYALVDGTWTEQERLQPPPDSSPPMAPAGDFAFGDDGTTWAGSEGVYGSGGGLLRYADGAWEQINPRGGNGEFIVLDLAVAPDGDVWVVGTDATTTTTIVDGVRGTTTTAGARWIARYDGASWEIFREADLGPALTVAGSLLAVAPDGSIWAAQADGLARFDGTTWSTVGPAGPFGGVAVAPDGTVWVIGPSGVGRLGDGAGE